MGAVMGEAMRTIWWDYDRQAVGMIDQTKLPEKLAVIEVGTIEDLCEAIVSLRVRGAPALGAAGAYGVALAAAISGAAKPEPLLKDVIKDVKIAAETIKASRPTAVNLSWGVDRVLRSIEGAGSSDEIRAAVLEEAERIAEEDVETNRALGEVGASLLEDGDTVLTHCNAGRLACVGWGTALGVIRSAAEVGKKIQVYACETRPLNQGSRLTAWELSEDEIPVTLICDNMSGMVMRQGLIDKVIVGADRITRDAVFNKIGTYTHAVLAKEHDIPFYVAAPLSTFDLGHVEKEITIEERDPDEVRKVGGKLLAPAGVEVYNPAFDATPMELVTGIITERGVFSPPELPYNI